MLQRMLFHLACVLALAWPAFVNGQPFYFPDTTAYVRAADSAVYIFSGQRISTEWTDHYRAALEPGGKVKDPARHVSANANDLGTDSVMAGRSPYFGALLWLSFVASRFWLFVLAQAAVAYALIRLALRLFGAGRPVIVAGCVAALCLLTPLPFFVSLLMPDLLAGFAILAFLLLAIDRGRLSRWERWALLALIAVSVMSHLTHILIIAAMALLLAGWALFRRWPRDAYAPLTGMSAAIVLLGFASVLLTGLVVERAFGRQPQLPPLLTARFLGDGPGLAFLRSQCPRAGFAACAYADRPKVDTVAFLWSTTPGQGAYMIADTRTRRALSIEDRAFAVAVLRAYPLEQGGMILVNAWRQLLRFDLDILNYNCPDRAQCWLALPTPERAALLGSPGGRGAWPQRAIAVTHYAAAGVALVLLIAWLWARRRGGGRIDEDLALWLCLVAVAVAVNVLLGGGISEPQPRYEARIVWLVPFLAMIAALGWRRGGSIEETGG